MSYQRNPSSFQIIDYCDNEIRGSSGISEEQEFPNNYSIEEKIEKLTKQLIAITQQLITLKIQQTNMQENNLVKQKPIALTLIELTSDVLQVPYELRKESYFEWEIQQNLSILGKISDIFVQCYEKIENIKGHQNQFQQSKVDDMDKDKTNLKPLTNQSMIFFSGIKSNFKKK